MTKDLLIKACIVLAVVVVAMVASAGTNTESAWYRALWKPPWQPPGWVFGVAWTAIYVMFAISAVLAWDATSGTMRTRVMMLFAINAVLNASWGFIFFQARMPAAAGIDIVALAMVLAVMIIRIWPASPVAALLLVPYLIWIIYASTLNWAIVRMN